MITNQIENSRVLGKSSIDNKHNNKRGRNRKYEREYSIERNIAQNLIIEKYLFFQKQNTMNLTKAEEEQEEKEVKGGNSSNVTVSILHS